MSHVCVDPWDMQKNLITVMITMITVVITMISLMITMPVLYRVVPEHFRVCTEHYQVWTEHYHLKELCRTLSFEGVLSKFDSVLCNSIVFWSRLYYDLKVC